jgi:hypothetical protein
MNEAQIRVRKERGRWNSQLKRLRKEYGRNEGRR